MQTTAYPPPISKGGLIRLVAPAGVFDQDRFYAGVRILEEQGFRVSFREDIFSQEYYLAGNDIRRIEELQEAFNDRKASIIWCVRGGYGSMRLLPHIDPATMLQYPKLLIGFSDITAIHGMLNRQGLVTLHGPMVASLATSPAKVLDRLWSTIGNSLPPEPLQWSPKRVIREGTCRGHLVGGNLSLITRLIGTDYLPPLEGAILVIEEIGEPPYRIDRMLTHLELCGIPKNLAGIVVGELTNCELKGVPYSALDILTMRIESWNIPALTSLPVGHGEINMPIPLGLGATLNSSYSAELRFKHSHQD